MSTWTHSFQWTFEKWSLLYFHSRNLRHSSCSFHIRQQTPWFLIVQCTSWPLVFCVSVSVQVSFMRQRRRKTEVHLGEARDNICGHTQFVDHVLVIFSMIGSSWIPLTCTQSPDSNSFDCADSYDDHTADDGSMGPIESEDSRKRQVTPCSRACTTCYWAYTCLDLVCTSLLPRLKFVLDSNIIWSCTGHYCRSNQ